MAYEGFSFAFADYMKAGLIDKIDNKLARDGIAMIDPLTFGSKLSEIPKLAVLSSDDEFMMMDWSNIWYDDYKQLGESHLLIPPNSDHGLVTNIYGVLSSMTTFMRSISAGITERPHFNYTRDASTGEITITVPP
jgi:PhoPQ-activated pathogenicity-related protein